MSVDRLRYKYERLSEKINASAIDYERGTAFVFPKYCKACGEGLVKPHQWDPRLQKGLFKRSFCSQECKDEGPRKGPIMKVNPSHTVYRKDYPVEEMAFIGMQIEKLEQKEAPIVKLIKKACTEFKLISEKLRFLELETGERWYPSRFYFWLSKID